MKLIIASMIAGLFAQAASATITCEQWTSGDLKVEVLREGDILNSKENWNKVDVIVNFDREQCKGYVDQELLRINGEYYWKFRTNDDPCDGGNSYGSLMTYDLSKAVAHMYDGDWYCPESWNDDEIAHNHRCNLGAEDLAAKKMKEFGFDFEVTTSNLEVRKPYIWWYVNVWGNITNKGGKRAQVQVMTNVKDCSYDGVSIRMLNL